MGRKKPNPRKLWQPTESWITDFETFKQALAGAIDLSHPAENAAYALGTYAGEISNFLRGKARGTSADQRAKVLIGGLRAELPGTKGDFQADERVLAFWANNRALRENLAERLAAERDEHRTAALDAPAGMDAAPTDRGFHAEPLPPDPAAAAVRPKLNRLVEVRYSLDESHNLGSPANPALLVQLTYGSGEPDPPGTPEGATLRLANCQIFVRHDGAEISEPGYGAETTFRLAFAGRRSELKFRREGTRGQEWRSVPGKTGRRLYGQSDYEMLCRFSRRPDDLAVAVQAYPNDFRLDRADRESRGYDEVDRIVTALARIYTLGRGEGGCYVLNSGTPSE